MIIFAFIILIKNKDFKNSNKNILLIYLLFYLAYFTIIPNKQIRFALIFLPVFTIISAFALVHLYTLTRKKSLTRVLFFMFILIFLSISFGKDINYYVWRFAKEPPIVEEYYQYFQNNPVSGKILTADPVPVAYSDVLFTPYYFSIDEAKKIIYNNTDAVGFIFSSYTFFCQEKSCTTLLNELLDILGKERTLVFEKEYGDRTYYIYLNKDLQ